MEYKIVAVSDGWTTSSFSKEATKVANELAADGWKLTKMTHGWLGLLSPKLFLVFER
ncbi:hypothetical protein CWE09_07810 [Aliidiomarina minuta]|uniref:DUF4177 domain-containing protein n=1 Tax=Aliidiomarina minuta TaxID=880057 RepID=A0A432WAH1_9GAMM|nr:DUF4177 domain-containing protein [Aliidiomarina minuta]RUO26598.1 hypothetical protein CWE09_07810 [Aliidiomarina minuta]